MQSLFQLDRDLLKLINHNWSNAFFDWLMPTMRNSNAWVPLYLFLILFTVINFRKTGWWWVAYAGCTAIITNFISSGLIKNNIFRLRPCHQEEFASWLNVLVAYKPQSSSFTSSHAANHFGIAMFLFITLKPKFGNWPALFFLWAGLICYAQAYVGVHYPIDLAAGALIGIISGYLTGKLFNKRYGLV